MKRVFLAIPLPVPPTTFTVDRVHLTESHLTPDGAIYDVLCEYLLPA